jgi:hypothetical protein
MSDQPDIVQPAPAPYSIQVQRIGDVTLETGDTVPLLRLSIFTLTGETRIFVKAPDALGIADLIREHAGGLTIAQTLDGRPQL